MPRSASMAPGLPRVAAVVLLTAAGALACARPAALSAQDTDVDRRIAEIRALYAATESGLDGFRVTRKEYHDLAVAGTVEAWWEGDEARKVVVRFDADGSSGRVEYFFHQGDLFFVFDRWETFPMWPDDDPDDFGPTENRFYFDESGLVRWLVRSHEGGMVDELVPATREGWRDRGRQVRDEATLFRAFATDPEEDLDEFRAVWRGGEG